MNRHRSNCLITTTRRGAFGRRDRRDDPPEGIDRERRQLIRPVPRYRAVTRLQGQALRYVAQRLDIPLEHILAVGGSGADEDMMRGNTLARRRCQPPSRGVVAAGRPGAHLLCRTPMPWASWRPSTTTTSSDPARCRNPHDRATADLYRPGSHPDPNGPQSESPNARQHFATLCARPEVTLAYVTGRHRALIEQAITFYRLPQPDFVIGDVGTTIYVVGQRRHRWIASGRGNRDRQGLGGQPHADIKSCSALPALRVRKPPNRTHSNSATTYRCRRPPGVVAPDRGVWRTTGSRRD